MHGHVSGADDAPGGVRQVRRVHGNPGASRTYRQRSSPRFRAIYRRGAEPASCSTTNRRMPESGGYVLLDDEQEDEVRV